MVEKAKKYSSFDYEVFGTVQGKKGEKKKESMKQEFILGCTLKKKPKNQVENEEKMEQASRFSGKCEKYTRRNSCRNSICLCFYSHFDKVQGDKAKCLLMQCVLLFILYIVLLSAFFNNYNSIQGKMAKRKGFPKVKVRNIILPLNFSKN